MLIVKRPFVGHGYNMPNPGELIDPPEPIRSQLIGINVAEPYNVKIDPPPAEIKKKEPSELLPPARRVTKKTAKRSRKSATK